MPIRSDRPLKHLTPGNDLESPGNAKRGRSRRSVREKGNRLATPRARNAGDRLSRKTGLGRVSGTCAMGLFSSGGKGRPKTGKRPTEI